MGVLKIRSYKKHNFRKGSSLLIQRKFLHGKIIKNAPFEGAFKNPLI
jgi:hypothetical protein